jgi:hypothetical protein
MPTSAQIEKRSAGAMVVARGAEGSSDMESRNR